ncbi:hypothetical protein [Legionella pneumophila]|uniref:hypothetical protein n=1 Tax=Legionella pneumophila TaxID=446 RepID=UPI00026D9E54|nr:hypothetical protein [Legionella pneumophila]MDW9138417.1 hypothetical protein [Legionella pneumophila]CCD07446.1 protein of unknown function [putative ankyrin repeat] [Legionella pneumophila subsp. pneumophila]CZI69301.1 Uncharacterised protein [Legionella pneumophila]CZR03721.1 Uncharacterised protein [Legionella pneumophila]STX65717.1 Uncharacterised protein [Legionella pneumophila]
MKEKLIELPRELWLEIMAMLNNKDFAAFRATDKKMAKISSPSFWARRIKKEFYSTPPKEAGAKILYQQLLSEKRKFVYYKILRELNHKKRDESGYDLLWEVTPEERIELTQMRLLRTSSDINEKQFLEALKLLKLESLYTSEMLTQELNTFDRILRKILSIPSSKITQESLDLIYKFDRDLLTEEMGEDDLGGKVLKAIEILNFFSDKKTEDFHLIAWGIADMFSMIPYLNLEGLFSLLLTKHPQLAHLHFFESSLLHSAAAGFNFKLCEQLIKLGANINLKIKERSVPLLSAFNAHELTEYLYRNSSGAKAIQQTIEVFLKNGVNLDLESKDPDSDGTIVSTREYVKSTVEWLNRLINKRKLQKYNTFYTTLIQCLTPILEHGKSPAMITPCNM